MMKRTILLTAVMVMSLMAFGQTREIKWDAHSLIMDGKRVVPAMGEAYSC